MHFRRSSKNHDTTIEKNNIISSVFNEFCSKTSVHGIGYLGDPKKNLYNKLWWIIICILCVIVCSFQIIYTWVKWQENPVIISISETQIPIWNIPFPAVTICPFNKIDRKKYKYREIYIKKYIPELIDKFFLDVSLLCNERSFNYTYMTDEEAIQRIYEVSPPMEMLFDSPKLNVKVVKFYNQITEDGLCYTYNSLNQNDMYTSNLNPEVTFIENGYQNEGWDIENGYPESLDSFFTYPNRTREGVKQGMRFNLFSNVTRRELACGDSFIGYKISLHNPAESPHTGQQYVLTPINKLTVIGVKPIVITSSEGLKNLDTNRRNCYFSYEKSLKFFKVYTQNNCKSECVANVTKSYCGCVAFYMPRNNKTKICGTNACIYDLEYEILAEFNVIKSCEKLKNKERKAYNIYNKCDCKPTCASLDYEYDSSQADFDLQGGIENKNVNNMPLKHLFLESVEHTSVNIFFKESQFMTLHRKELFTRTDFLASCGGLLGLFMGVSFVSMMEIIYFCTIRLWCKFKYD